MRPLDSVTQAVPPGLQPGRQRKRVFIGAKVTSVPSREVWRVLETNNGAQMNCEEDSEVWVVPLGAKLRDRGAGMKLMKTAPQLVDKDTKDSTGNHLTKIPCMGVRI